MSDRILLASVDFAATGPVAQVFFELDAATYDVWDFVAYDLRNEVPGGLLVWGFSTDGTTMRTDIDADVYSAWDYTTGSLLSGSGTNSFSTVQLQYPRGIETGGLRFYSIITGQVMIDTQSPSDPNGLYGLTIKTDMVGNSNAEETPHGGIYTGAYTPTGNKDPVQAIVLANNNGSSFTRGTINFYGKKIVAPEP